MIKKKFQLILIATLTSFALCGCTTTSKEAKAVIEQIEELEEVSLDSQEEIAQAYSDYLDLSDKDKEAVSNYDELEKAIKEFDKLQAENVISQIDSFTYENLETLNTCIEDFWEYWNDEQRETVLAALGRCSLEKEFEEQIKKHLKSPDSFNLYSYEDSVVPVADYYAGIVTIKYGATNSFGAEITETLTASIDYEIDLETKSITITHFGCPELLF